MIIRDENGRAISVESLSDITKEVNDIEDIISKAVASKKKGGSMPEDEKAALKLRLEDLGVIMSNIDDELKHSAKPWELMPFIKALTKLKKLADTAKSELGND